MSKPRGQRAPRRSDKCGFELPATSQQVLPVGRLCFNSSQRGTMTRHGQTRVSLTILLAMLLALALDAQAACVSPSGQSSHQVFKTDIGLQFCPDGENWSTFLANGAGVPGGSTGYVQFNSSGAFAGDSGLFWDNSNKWLGIGTASPSYKLDVDGSTRFTDTMAVTMAVGSTGSRVKAWECAAGGGCLAIDDNSAVRKVQFRADGEVNYIVGSNVGIGTELPNGRLTIADNGMSASFVLNIFSDDSVPWALNMRNTTANQDWAFFIENNDTLELRDRTDANRQAMAWDGNGNVGIGTSDPTEKLEVNGNVKMGWERIIGYGDGFNTHRTATCSGSKRVLGGGCNCNGSLIWGGPDTDNRYYCACNVAPANGVVAAVAICANMR